MPDHARNTSCSVLSRLSNPFGALAAFVFVGALLLFSLEPLVGRLLLPRFGGAFHVWTTALMFFQGALFMAYLYAHLVAGRIGRWHLLVVALPLLWLPPGVGDGAAASAGTPAILLLLLRHIALPFTVLATTAVVAQRWWTESALGQSGREPYGLYAISNAGSLGALLVYALVVEPFVGLTTQRWLWTGGFVLYLALAAVAFVRKGPPALAPAEVSQPAAPPRARVLVYWALLSAAPSAFLMAVTNLIALEAGSIPLVWVVPLAIYLGSFVVAFASRSDGGSRVPGFVRRLWPHIAAVGLFFFSGGDAGGGWIAATLQLAVLAVVTLAAHGELFRARPAPRHLTLYYLVIAAGGWAGGAFVALVAPVLFDGLYEYPVALVGLALTMAVARRDALRTWLRTAPKLALGVSAALLVVIALKVADANLSAEGTTTLAVQRSFYGLYRVSETPRADHRVRDLVSGNTRHGRQRRGDTTPLSYYHSEGPLGDALSTLPSPRRIGAVGLGVGAAAGHLSAGDTMRFYEIDAVVVELARAHFTYLEDTDGEVEVVVGDARVSLEAERAARAPRYALLFVDAFAGDAIPTHLLTLEALRLYLSRLTDDGLLLLHVSNRYYDLRPILAAGAARLGLAGAEVARLTNLAADQDPSQYVALARSPERVAPLIEEHGWAPLSSGGASPAAWTDDHVNFFDALLPSL